MEYINRIIWPIAISLILVNSIYYSIKLKFPQFRFINTFRNITQTSNKQSISPTDTLIMALSSKIGVGSLAGIAIAIKLAGIGTIFWIWISTFFLSIITYVENALSIIYQEKSEFNPDGGPSYYIKKGLKNKQLSIIYSISIIILYSVLFSSMQSNTITTLTNQMCSINKIIISLVVVVSVTLIITKGIKTISSICNKVFPIMMLIFLLLGLITIMNNFDELPHLLITILKDAFNKNSINGGIIYTIIISLQKSIFANESGVGTSAIISGSANNSNYKMQGNLGIIQTYFINFVVLTTATVIIGLSKVNAININNGIELTRFAFKYHFGLSGELLLLIILILFSFSTIITIYYYGESALKSISKKRKYTITLKIITIISLFSGGILKGQEIWSFIDLFLAITTIINMYAIYKLKSKVVLNLQKK